MQVAPIRSDRRSCRVNDESETAANFLDRRTHARKSAHTHIHTSSIVLRYFVHRSKRYAAGSARETTGYRARFRC